jgi:predicted nucleotidyltransferase
MARLMTSLPAKAPDIRRLLEPLVRHGVDFVLIGGMAGIAQGSNYPSFDLDVAYSRDKANVSRLVAALKEIGVRLRGAPADVSFQLDERAIENGANFTFVTPFGDFDVLADIAGIRSYDELRVKAEEKEYFGLSVRVASLDHLIAMKRAANRPKDRNMLEEYLVLAEKIRLSEEGGGSD